MKIRNGFVSNSSSSSFLVRYKEIPFGEKEKDWVNLSESNAKKLETYGFKKAKFYSASAITGNYKDKRYKINKSDKYYNYVYDVLCNEDEVIHFLIKNKIPFESEVHYGDYFIKFDGKDKILMATNYGNMLSGMNIYDTKEGRKKYGFFDTKPIKEITVSEYKKKGLYFNENSKWFRE